MKRISPSTLVAFCFAFVVVISVFFPGEALAQTSSEEAFEEATDPVPTGNSCAELHVPQMGCVPAGVFLRGENGRHRAARPQESVELDVYWMDRNEVTTAAYRECVRQKKCKKAGPNYSDFSAPQQPVTGVNWFHADAFCRAQGKHLPTEAEWEKAARGEKGAPFSWGNAPATCKRAVLKNSRGRSCGKKKKGRSGKPEVGRPEKVGSKAAGVYGLFDMAGNSWEWVADWSSSSYKTCGEACRGKNPKGPCAGRSPCKGHREKVVRGGSWYWPASYATAFRRRKHVPRNWPFHHFGFRCAANLAEARTLAKANLEE